MSLSITDIAALAGAIKSPARVKDADARALAMRTKAAHRAEAVREAERSAERYLSYSPAQELAITALREVHWPRARAVRNEIGAARAVISAHFDKFDDTVSLSQCELYDAIRREWRLSLLLTRCNAASAAIGKFPLCRTDMRADAGTRFIKSAWKRHFTFAGGRDAGSAEYEPADIVQGAFIRAIDNGDTVDGVPTFGAMFRHVQAERAHLTRVSNAEYAARKRAALGETVEDDTVWEDNKHTLRKLGTMNYPSLEQHRLAQAIAHRDAELELLDDAVTNAAREEVLDGASEREFHIVLARILMSGATLEEVSEALGLTVDTIKRNAFESADKSLRHIGTGIDHSERSVDMHNRAEHEQEVDEAQARHAEKLRLRRWIAECATYAHRGVFTPVDVPLANSAPGKALWSSYDGETVTAADATRREYFHPTNGWIYAPEVYRGIAVTA